MQLLAVAACYLSGQLLSNLLQLLLGCDGVSTPGCVEEDQRDVRHAPQALHLVYLTQVEVHHRGVWGEEAQRWWRWCHHILGPAVERRAFRRVPAAFGSDSVSRHLSLICLKFHSCSCC